MPCLAARSARQGNSPEAPISRRAMRPCLALCSVRASPPQGGTEGRGHDEPSRRVGSLHWLALPLLVSLLADSRCVSRREAEGATLRHLPGDVYSVAV